MSNLISIPDPQVLEMNALDEAFSRYMDDLADDPTENLEEQDYLWERWNEIDSNALVFFIGSDDYYEGDGEVWDHAMSKDMADRIRLKREVINQINSEENDAS